VLEVGSALIVLEHSEAQAILATARIHQARLYTMDSDFQASMTLS
jgi:hypothetical protein